MGEGLAVDDQGRIIVGGATGGEPTVFIARLTAEGSLDPSFGEQGVFSSRVFGCASAPRIRDLVAYPQGVPSAGSIAIAGHCETEADESSRGIVVRIEPNGAPDLSFRGDGQTSAIRLDSTSADGETYLEALSPAPDGGLFLAGWTGDAFFQEPVIARLDASGNLNPDFHFDGEITVAFPDAPSPGGGLTTIELVPFSDLNGRLIAAGWTGVYETFALVGLEPRFGSYDASFGAYDPFRAQRSGRTVTDLSPFGPEAADAMSVATDGSLLLAGFAEDGGLALAKYHPDGSQDFSFSSDGVAFSAPIRAAAVEVDSAGSPLTVGGLRPFPTDGIQLGLARFRESGLDGPPATRINGVTADGDLIRVGLSSDEPFVGFRCRLNREQYEGCDSPAIFDLPEAGVHRITVRAIDRAGQSDPSPLRTFVQHGRTLLIRAVEYLFPRSLRRLVGAA